MAEPTICPLCSAPHETDEHCYDDDDAWTPTCAEAPMADETERGEARVCDVWPDSVAWVMRHADIFADIAAECEKHPEVETGPRYTEGIYDHLIQEAARCVIAALALDRKAAT